MYQPDYDAARAEPHVLGVTVGDGESPGQRHEWRIAVTDVNRLPKMVKLNPPPQSVINADVGAKVRFEAEASDADGDPLRYAWTVDGKAVPETSRLLDWKVTGDHRVRARVSDGKGESEPAEWKVASIPPFQFDPRPQKRDLTVRFKESQRFEVVPRFDAAKVDVTYAWTVDRKPVEAGRTLQLDADQPQWVRQSPVVVEVTATAAPDRKYSFAWQANVLPPIPALIDSDPQDQSVTVTPGQSKTFEMTAAKPVEGQGYKYVFGLDGKEVRSDSPRYELVAGDRDAYELAAYVEDNFKQKSERRLWKIRKITDDVLTLTRTWLEELRRAFEKRDVATLTAMQRLLPEQQERLVAAFKTQSNLRVAFEDVDVKPLDGGKARARYRRVDSFVDPNGTPRTYNITVEQTFRLSDGRITLEK